MRDLEPIRLMIAALCSVPVVWEQQNGPRLTPPYVAIRSMRERVMENSEYLHADANGIQTVLTTIEITIEVQAYGGGSGDLLRDMREASRFLSFLESMPPGWGIVKRSEITDITALLDGITLEDRSRLEFDLRAALQSLDDTGYIQTVNYSGHLSDIAGVVSGTVTGS